MVRFMKWMSLLLVLALSSCGTTDKKMRNEGHSEAYIQGFHDGRHSGLKEAGNHYEHYLRDEARFRNDQEYRKGWLAGEAEGKHLQHQAAGIGNAAGNAYSSARISKEVEHQQDFDGVARGAAKHADSSALKALE